MIVNVLSVSLLFVDVVCLALAVLLVVVSFRQLRRAAALADVEARERFERRVTLGLLVSLILAGLRALSWPLMYATLDSFVPTIDGAMCIYGVTRSLPGLARTLEILKPVVFWLAGAWLLVNQLDFRSRTAPLARSKMVLLLGAAVAMLVEIPLEMALILGIKPTFVVTCCTTVADVADRATSLVPRQLLGEQYLSVLVWAFACLHVLLVLLAFAVAFTSAGRQRGALRSALIGIGSLLAFVHLGLGWLVATELLAPAWMGLPYHHCLYCFVAHGDAPLAIGAFVVGLFALWWAALVSGLARGHELEQLGDEMLRRCHGWSFFLLMGSGGMALVHHWVNSS